MVIRVNEDSPCTFKYWADIAAMATKIPGFVGFSDFKIGLLDSDMILPIKEYVRLYW